MVKVLQVESRNELEKLVYFKEISYKDIAKFLDNTIEKAKKENNTQLLLNLENYFLLKHHEIEDYLIKNDQKIIFNPQV